MNSALNFNAKLKIIESPLCTFAENMVWSQYKGWLRRYITIGTLTLQSELIGFFKDVSKSDYAFTNNILLMFKREIYEL